MDLYDPTFPARYRAPEAAGDPFPGDAASDALRDELATARAALRAKAGELAGCRLGLVAATQERDDALGRERYLNELVKNFDRVNRGLRARLLAGDHVRSIGTGGYHGGGCPTAQPAPGVPTMTESPAPAPPRPPPPPPADCPCGGSIDLSQPDQRRPRHLLGACLDCGRWYRLDRPGGTAVETAAPDEPD